MKSIETDSILNDVIDLAVADIALDKLRLMTDTDDNDP
jgi:hypothetical protein